MAQIHQTLTPETIEFGRPVSTRRSEVLQQPVPHVLPDPARPALEDRQLFNEERVFRVKDGQVRGLAQGRLVSLSRQRGASSQGGGRAGRGRKIDWRLRTGAVVLVCLAQFRRGFRTSIGRGEGFADWTLGGKQGGKHARYDRPDAAALPPNRGRRRLFWRGKSRGRNRRKFEKRMTTTERKNAARYYPYGV